MGTKTVHTTAYQIIADTSKFERGAALTRKELSLQKRTLRGLESPLDKHERKQQELGELYKKGAITQQQYVDALDAHADKLGLVNKKQSKFAALMEKSKKAASRFKVAIGLVGGVIGGTVAGTLALGAKVRDLNQEMKDFERFGLNASSSLGMFKVMAMDAGLSVEDLVDLTKDLGIRIGEANIDGEGEIFETFQKLGLNVKQLQGMRPEVQLAKFADAISRVENETEKLAITDILLSDAGTKALEMLSKGSGVMSDAAERANQLGMNLSAVDYEQLQEAQDNLNELNRAWTALGQQLAVTVVPWLTAAIDVLNQLTLDRSEKNVRGGKVSDVRAMRNGMSNAAWERRNRLMKQEERRGWAPGPLAEQQREAQQREEQRRKQEQQNEEMIGLLREANEQRRNPPAQNPDTIPFGAT